MSSNLAAAHTEGTGSCASRRRRRRRRRGNGLVDDERGEECDDKESDKDQSRLDAARETCLSMMTTTVQVAGEQPSSSSSAAAVFFLFAAPTRIRETMPSNADDKRKHARCVACLGGKRETSLSFGSRDTQISRDLTTERERERVTLTPTRGIRQFEENRQRTDSSKKNSCFLLIARGRESKSSRVGEGGYDEWKGERGEEREQSSKKAMARSVRARARARKFGSSSDPREQGRWPLFFFFSSLVVDFDFEYHYLSFL